MERLYRSLEAQTFKDFVWIVALDGDPDFSLDFLNRIRFDSSFRIRIIYSETRLGKPVLDNLLLTSVATEFYLNCDSDDTLTEDALDIMVKQIERLDNNGDKLDFVMGVNIRSTGELETKFRNRDFYSVSPPSTAIFSDLLNSVIGDATYLFRTNPFAKIRHREVDFIVTEAAAYLQLKDRILRGVMLFEPVKIMDRATQNSVSYSKGIKYCRGSAYSVRDSLIYLASNKNGPTNLRLLLNFARYVHNGELDAEFFFTPLRVIATPWYFSMPLYWLGFIFSLRDIAFGGLERTHREFLINYSRRSIYEVMPLGPPLSLLNSPC